VNCRVEKRDCVDVTYPCGQNADGSIIMCMEEVCDHVRVCDVICDGQPNPDAPPGFPEFPEIPDFPPGPIDPIPF
jgi:hypothetical protein